MVSCNGERKNSNYKFLLHIGLLRLLLHGCLDSGHSVNCSVPAFTQCSTEAQSGVRTAAGLWEASQGGSLFSVTCKSNWLHFSSQHMEIGMVNLYVIVVTTQSHEDDRCLKSHYKAVFQRWRQTQCKAKARSSVRVNQAVTTRGTQTARLQSYSFLVCRSASQLGYLGLSRLAWLCIQASRTGRTCTSQTAAWGLTLHMANEFCWCSAGPSTTPPCLNYEGPKDQPFPGRGSNPAQGLQELIYSDLERHVILMAYHARHDTV